MVKGLALIEINYSYASFPIKTKKSFLKVHFASPCMFYINHVCTVS